MIGATARYVLAEAVPTAEAGFPFSTLIANIFGSFVLGVFVIAGADVVASKRLLGPFFAVGLIGSFTTFSAFAVESVVLVDRDEHLLAVAYVATSLAFGLAAAWCGMGAARRFGQARR